MCAGSVDGLVQTGIFFLRNSGKVATGKDTGRVGAAGAQLASLTDKVAEEASIFGNTISGAAKSATNFIDDGILAIAEGIGGQKAVNTLNGLQEATKAGSVFGAVAQKAVNPLLVTAAGIRILKDDDQYAALIEEGCAMGAMFGAEKLMKIAKNGFFEAAENGVKTVAKEAQKTGVKNNLKNIFNEAVKKYNTFGKTGKGITKVLIGLAFVAGSIGAYTIGKTVGKKLSGRD